MLADIAGVGGFFVDIASGAVTTVFMTVVTMATSLVVGVPLAVLRTQEKSRFVSVLAGAWIELFRSTPLLLQLLWIYYVVPSLIGLRMSALLTGYVCFVLHVSAFNAETFRAGLGSIPPGQREAALALGMTRWKAFTRVLLPQAVRRILPPLGTTWIQLFQNTSVLAFINVGELTFKSISLSNATYQSLPIYTALAVWYLVLGYPQAKGVEWLYRHVKAA